MAGSPVQPGPIVSVRPARMTQQGSALKRNHNIWARCGGADLQFLSRIMFKASLGWWEPWADLWDPFNYFKLVCACVYVFRCGGQRESALSICHVGSRDRLRCQPEGVYSFQWRLAACSVWPPQVCLTQEFSWKQDWAIALSESHYVLEFKMKDKSED